MKSFLTKKLALSEGQKQVMYNVFLFGLLLTVANIVVAYNANVWGAGLFVLFNIINEIHERRERKDHAPKLWRIRAYYMCWICSCFLLFSVLTVGKINIELGGETQSIILSFLVMTGCAVFIGDSGIYGQIPTENMSARHKIKQIMRGMKPKQAKEHLLELLPERQALSVYWIEYEELTINETADLKMFCSSRTVGNLRNKAFDRLSQIYKD